MSSSSTVSTRFMIISDTHSFQFGAAEACGGSFALPVPKVDVLLHCGDLTQAGGSDAYRGVLKMLSHVPAELKLIIAGNHDLSLDGEYWRTRKYPWKPRDPVRDPASEDTEHDEAVEIMTGPLAKEAGVTYLVEGLNTFTLSNGAVFTIYTSPYQPEFGRWAFPYTRTQDRFNPPHQTVPGTTSIARNPIPDFPAVDIIMTHGPPRNILDSTVHGSVGCQSLLRAASRARPRMYCFGHIHEAYGADVVRWRDGEGLVGLNSIEAKISMKNTYPEPANFKFEFGKETLMVNAAIMSLAYRPTNAPWLVDLDLPRAAVDTAVEMTG